MSELPDDFVAGLVIGAGCAAHAFVGVDDQTLNLALYNARQQIIIGFANLGPEFATAIADAFVTAVSARKFEIEAAESEGAL